MKRDWQMVLGRFLRQLQCWLILETWGFVFCRLALVLFPIGALAVMVDQRWFAGAHSISITLSTLVPLAIIPLGYAFLHRGTQLHQAFEMDGRADLKDRISSAWEFLSQESMTAEQELQVRDAVRTAHDVDLPSLLTIGQSRLPRWALAALCVFVASFFVPAVYRFPEAEAAVDLVRLLQLDEIETLREEVARMAREEEDLQDLLEKLKAMEQRFAAGEIGERDVMIALGRMDKELQARMEAMGVAAFSAQFDQVVPDLMAAAAARPVAQAIKAGKLDEAAKALEKLGENLRMGQLSPEEKAQLIQQMQAAASNLGKGEKGSLGADFDAAAASVKSGDREGTARSMKSIEGKLQQGNRYRQMQAARGGLGEAKASLGNKSALMAKKGQGESSDLSDKPANEAGKGSAAPLGDRKRLGDSYRELLHVQGVAGDGPVESEVEITEGQTSPSGRSAQDLYNEYAATAEQAIEGEAIPLSHRFHVKRYFQAIRPVE